MSDLEIWEFGDVEIYGTQISTSPPLQMSKSLGKVFVECALLDPPRRSDLLAGELAGLQDREDVAFGDFQEIRHIAGREELGQASATRRACGGGSGAGFRRGGLSNALVHHLLRHRQADRHLGR